MLLLQHFTSSCSTCKTTKNKSFFFKNKSRKNGLSSECKDCVKVYQSLNKHRISCYTKEYEIINKEQISTRRKNERINDPDKFKKRNKEYKEKNIEKIREYRIINRERQLDINKKYRQTEIGKATRKNSHHKRRTLKKEGDVTTEQILELQKSTNCYWCNIPLINIETHIDHYVPLAKGGGHTISNLVASCYKCNTSKGAKSPESFANSIGKLL